MKTLLFSSVLLLLLSATAHAAPILAAGGPAEDLARGYERQQDTFARSESGMNFDAFVKESDRQLITDFFAQSEDFETFAGRHVFTTLDSFDEHGDMGNFSGIASVGLAARLMVLKRDNAPADEIARARDACVRAARTWHVFGAIAGPGTIARGVRRIAPIGSEPALPGAIPELVPLKDSSGNALPAKKGETWRAPVAPGFDGWIWKDDTSKDQVSGYALAIVWLWDALKGDPAAPQDVVTAMAEDLVRFAKVLMTPIPEKEGVDLVVRDADGRLTSFGDLNSRILSGTAGGVFAEDSALQNGFNAALAMGIIRGAVHVSGDATLEKYFYEELVGKRQYPKHAVATATLMYTGESTNFSNVNMLAIALATLGRIESDATVRGELQELIENFWDNGSSRCAARVAQPWYDVIVAGFGKTEKGEVPARMAGALAAYSPAPTFQRDRINCDDGEIGAGSCLAIDGTTTIALSTRKGHGGGVVAQSPVPISVRPDSNFLWRSDPHEVNGGGGNRLNPRGDWLAAYWLGRLLDRDPTKNLSPNVTKPIPIPDPDPVTPSDPSSPGSPDDPHDQTSDDGCSTSGAPAHGGEAAWLVALALVIRRWRGRRDGSRAASPKRAATPEDEIRA
jgi:hypothetical protein